MIALGPRAGHQELPSNARFRTRRQHGNRRAPTSAASACIWRRGAKDKTQRRSTPRRSSTQVVFKLAFTQRYLLRFQPLSLVGKVRQAC